MANLILPHRWRRQPTGASRINAAHWAAPALISASTFGLNYDHKTGLLLEKTGTPETVSSPQRSASLAPRVNHTPGLSMYSASTSSYLTRQFAPDLNVEKIIVLARAASIAASNSYIAIRDYDGVSVPWALFFDASFAVGASGAGFAFFDGGWRSAVGSSILATGMRTVGGSYDGADIKGYVDGALDSQTAYAGVLPTSSTKGVDFGRYGNESTVFNGFLESCLIFDGTKIPAGDYDYAVKSLTDEFYAIFQPLQRRLYFAPSAGANLTLDGNPGLLKFIGQSATLTLTGDLSLTAEPGLLRFQGQSADLALSSGLVLDTTPGVVRFVGQQANLALTENPALATAPGYVRLHGQVADLTVTGPIVITGEPGRLRFRGLAAEITLTGGGDTDIATNPKLIARHYPNLEFRPVGRKRWKVEGREAELDILPFRRGLGIGPVVVPPLPPRPKAPVTKLPVTPKKAPPPPALVIAPPALGPVLPPPAAPDDPRVPALERAVEAIRAEYDVALRRLLLAEGEAAALREELRVARDGFASDIVALRKEVADLGKLARQARNLAIRR